MSPLDVSKFELQTWSGRLLQLIRSFSLIRKPRDSYPTFPSLSILAFLTSGPAVPIRKTASAGVGR